MAVGGSYVVNAASPRKDLGIAFLNSFATPEMGNRWLENVLVQTGIKTDHSKISGPHADYFKQLAKRQRRQQYYFGTPIQVMQGKPKEVFTQVINNALPAGSISVDDVVKQMNAAEVSRRAPGSVVKAARPRTRERGRCAQPWRAVIAFLLPALTLYVALHRLPGAADAVEQLAQRAAARQRVRRPRQLRRARAGRDLLARGPQHADLGLHLAAVRGRRSRSLLALALYAKVPGQRFFRIAWFTPVLMSYVVVGIIWAWIYNYDWGAVNYAPARARPRALDARLARQAGDGAAGADLHHHLDVDRLQHGRAAGRAALAALAR